jgi:hypothetical protein
MGEAVNWLLRVFHSHKFEKIPGTMEPSGVTLGWDMRPTTQYRMLERCACGAERSSDGWVLPRKAEEHYARSPSPSR